MTAGNDLCARKIREPPLESPRRGFLFALGGIHASARFLRPAGAISRGRVDF